MIDVLQEMAADAGRILEGYYGRLDSSHAERKAGRRRDLVSRADREAEQCILDRIPAGDDVVAEEGGSRATGASRCWYVDPLDGTINYQHGIPFWGVSLAVLDHGELRAAVVHAPALGLTFSAEAGRGTRLGDKPVGVSSVADIRDAILATGFPYARDTLADNNLVNVTRVGPIAGGLRRLGSAALDLALTACGRLDGYWELHLEPWDVAAGALLVREAGGRVTDARGVETTLTVLNGRNVVATNGLFHDRLRSLLEPLREI